MIYRMLGRIVRQAWWLVLLSWCLLLWAASWWAPPWNEVAQDKEFAFLPADAPSRRAEKVHADAFPDDRAGSNIVVVLYRGGAQAAQRRQDLQFIEEVLEPGLRQIA